MLTSLKYFLSLLLMVYVYACNFGDAVYSLADATSKAEQACSRDSGYTVGVNDGKNGRDMRSNFTPEESCSSEQLLQVREGYQEGYKFGLANQPPQAPLVVAEPKLDSSHPKWECKESYDKKIKVCGFNCRVGFTRVICTNNPKIFCPHPAEKFNINIDKLDERSLNGVKCGENCTYNTKTKVESCDSSPYYQWVKSLN